MNQHRLLALPSLSHPQSLLPSRECSLCHEHKRLFVCRDCNTAAFTALRRQIAAVNHEVTIAEKNLAAILRNRAVSESRAQSLQVRRLRIQQLTRAITLEERLTALLRHRLNLRRKDLEWRREAFMISDSFVESSLQRSQSLSLDYRVRLQSLTDDQSKQLRRVFHTLTRQLLKILNVRRSSLHACSIASVSLNDDLESQSLSLSDEKLIELSSALGLIALFTNTVCHWLRIHLPHPLLFAGSHSAVLYNHIDPTTNTVTPVTYSLYLNRTDPDSFHRALTLLALDIQFVCWSVGMSDVPLYRLLPNLMELCQAVTLDRTQRRRAPQQSSLAQRVSASRNNNVDGGGGPASRPIVVGNFADGDDEWVNIELEQGIDDDDED